MANKKFSEFTSQTDSANVQFVVGYNGSDNVRISPGNLLGAYLPLAGGTMSGNTIHGDNVKSLYGTGSDLQIYHDGSNSYIDETGTGSLYIKSAGAIRLQSNTGENMIYAINDGAVNLYHNNSNKLQTTSTGVSVTTEIKAITNGTLFLDNTNNNNPYYLYNSGSNLASLQIGRGTSPGTNVAMAFDNTGNVGIGTTAPSELLQLKPASGADSKISLLKSDGTEKALIGYDNGNGALINLYNEAGTKNVFIRGYGNSYFNGGNFGIGTTTPSHPLDVKGEDTDNATIARFYSNTSTRGSFGIKNGVNVNPSIFIGTLGGSEQLAIGVNNTESIRINGSGNVGIGTSSPSEKLQINSGDVLINNSTVSTLKSGGSLYIDLNTFGSYSGRNFRILDNGSSLVNVKQTGEVGIGTDAPTAKLQVVGLAEHADNSAATTAGLTAGAFYRTGDLLKVVH